MNTIFHVGHRKCASTYLQDVVFARHPQLQMLERNDLPRYIALAQEADYDTQYVSERFACAKTLSERGNKTRLVISEERMLTVPGIDSGTIAKRLHNIDQDGLVIIVIRNQEDFLLSNHSQCVATGKTKLYSFKDWVESIKRSGDRNTYLEKANFYDQIRAFDALFGATHVGVFLLEDMRANPTGFARRLGKFTGIDLSGPEYDLEQHDHFDGRSGKKSKMARSSRWSILAKSSPILRTFDGLLRPFTTPSVRRAIGRATGLSSPHNMAADPATRLWIAERYRGCNQRLGERLGRDLSPLGYPL